MYSIYFEIFFLVFNWKPISSVSKNNILKKEVIQSYQKKDFETAEKKLKLLVGVFENEPELAYNLGIALYKQKKYQEARKLYLKLQNSNNIQVAVDALFQLGQISIINKDSSAAIQFYESALKKDFKNSIIRYNLALLKSKYLNKRKLGSAKNNLSKVSAINNSSKLNQEIDPLSEKQAVLARLSKINLSESHAKNIFDALGKTEAKYIQQKKRSSNHNNKQNYQTW
jgi:Ca-activated chloride channel homolog